MGRITSLLITLSLASAPAALVAAEAHVHGQAHLNVAVDDDTLILMLESPTDSLVGFEHAPSSKADLAAVARMKETLENADELFVPTAAAGCELARVELHSPLLDEEDELGHAHEPDHEGHEAHEAGEEHEDHEDHDSHEGHADLDGTFELRCAHPEALHDLEVRVFNAFPRLEKVKVAVVAPDGQTAAELTPAENRVSW